MRGPLLSRRAVGSAAFSGLLDVVRIDRPVELPPRRSLCLKATAQLPLIRLLAALPLIVPRHSGP
jgi:hypothetical protein